MEDDKKSSVASFKEIEVTAKVAKKPKIKPLPMNFLHGKIAKKYPDHRWP